MSSRAQRGTFALSVKGPSLRSGSQGPLASLALPYMLLETLLPLGKVDPGLRAPEVPLDLASIGRNAKLLEDIGYHGMVVEETKDDPFVIMALAAQATT